MSPLRLVSRIADPDNAETADAGAIPAGVYTNSATVQD